MKYEDIIRKIFKNYKSKRELKKEFDIINNTPLPVKIIREHHDIIPIKHMRSINRYDIMQLNEQEQKVMYERIKYEIERNMFDYLVSNNLIKFEKQFNIYEGTEELTGYMRIVRWKNDRLLY